MGGCFFSCVVGCSQLADYTKYKACKIVSGCAVCTNNSPVKVKGYKTYAIDSAMCDGHSVLAKLRVFMEFYWTKSTPMNGFDFRVYMKLFGNNLRIKMRDLDDHEEKKDTAHVSNKTRDLYIFYCTESSRTYIVENHACRIADFNFVSLDAIWPAEPDMEISLDLLD